jgi:ABC-type amino acid transport substrate-binding protein
MMRFMMGALCLVMCLVSLPVRAELVLNNILKSGTLKLGYRDQSPPFSFLGADQRPQGYSIELCKSVASEIAAKMGNRTLEIKWVAVDASNRFDALRNGDIDLLCGNTTQTLARRAEFDFSLTTFVDGAGVLYRIGEQAKTDQEMHGLRFVVVKGTTTEATIDKLIVSSKLGAKLLRAQDHEEALAALRDKRANAYAADRTVLITTALNGGGQYELSPVQLSYEPYGLAFRRDADLRLLVDRSLARLYRSGEIQVIMSRWFAPMAYPTPVLDTMIQLNALPE